MPLSVCPVVYLTSRAGAACPLCLSHHARFVYLTVQVRQLVTDLNSQLVHFASVAQVE